MKQNLLKGLLLFTLSAILPQTIRAEREVSQLQFGKQTITVASDEEITFYDWKGSDNISSSSSNNAHSLTVFTPAEAGMSIQVTFESCDISNDGSNWPGQVHVYSGNPDADDSFSWATTTSEVTASTTMPAGNTLEVLDGTYSDKTYVSAASDGTLSVGVLWRYAKGGNGWVAKVKCVKLENQVVTGAGSSYDNVIASPTTKVNVPLAAVYVTAEGVMNPDNVTSITFRLPKNEGVVDPMSIKVFRGNAASLKDATPIAASVTAKDDLYILTLSAEPSEGTTYFTLAADILSTATMGAEVQLQVVSVTTTALAEGITPFTAADPVTVVNPAIVFMSSTTEQVITVGTTTLNFYDEGGADGTIKGTASGQVSFLPEVDGQKVQIDFSKIDINNGSMYFQALNIYNGTEATAANLIKTMRSGDSGIVHSTSADGALTVVLTAASQSYEYDGWEATVSLFTPQAMEVDEFEVEQYTEGTVAAGDTGQQILSFNIKTKNTEPAMTASAFTFSTNETNAIISHATLYFTQADNSFSAIESNKFGEVDVTANSFIITADEAVTLHEDDNYFWLTYDVSDDALNDDIIDAALVSATLNGNAVEVANGNPEGSRSVRNIVLCYANMGSQTRTVNGSVVFETKTASSFSSYCEAGTDDRIVTFVPKHEGMVTQIDFSLFNVQYSSSSYGTKSKFVIYSGHDTSGDILWQLNSNEQESVGPDATIRSTAEDGSLTIVFNPNSSYSYYYKGFTATVSEYLSQDMQVAAVNVAQASTDVISIGGKNQALLTLNIQTEGNLNPLTLQSLSLDLKGTQQNIDQVLLYSEADIEAVLASAASTEEALLTLTLDEPFILKEGDNFLSLYVDINADAIAESTVDAAITGLTVSDTSVDVADGDPEGCRTLKLMYLLHSGDNGELVISADRPIMFYDDGGADGNASANFSGSITFVPKEPADAIQLDFKAWDVYYTSKFNLYQGGSVTDSYDAQYSMYDKVLENGPVTSKSDDGKITIQFTTGTSGPAGFAIEVSAYQKQPVTIDNITAEAISPAEVLKGETDVQMLKIAVEATGELGSVDITQFCFSATDMTPVTAANIYATGTVGNFSANTLYGTATENTGLVEGQYTIAAPGTYYFWLTYDLATDAEVGSIVDATLTTVMIDDSSITLTETPTASFTVATGKSGDYTIGIGGDYTTIQGAIDDIAHLGIDGAVTLNILPGEYNEKVNVPAIKGMSAINTLTIQSQNGNYGDVRIFHNNYTTAGYSDDQMAKEYGVFTFDGASYTTLRGVEITTTDLSYPSVVHVKNQSRHCTIESCYLHAETTTSYPNSIKIISHYAENEANRNNDYLAVRNNVIEGGYMGVSMGGTTYVALPKEVGGIIEGNTLKNQGSKAIYLMDELGAKVRNNVIINEVETNTNFMGIDAQLRDEYGESVEITGNIFNIASTKYGGGIYLRQMTASATAPTIVANNVVNVTSLNASYYGIKVDNKTYSNLNIANNTVRLTGENGGAALWFASNMSESVGINVVNNIIQNETSGYAVNLYNDNNLSVVNFQNNTFYTAGETFFRASSSTTGDFAAFVEQTGATACINAQVNFLSDNILEPADNLNGQLLTALSLDYVTTDVAGTPRSTTPTIGAYEFSDDNADPVVAEGYPLIASVSTESALVAIKADVNGTAYAVLQAPDQVAPTAEQVMQSITKTTINRDTEATIKFEGLETGIDYVVYLVVESTRGKQTELMTLPFTTASIIPDVTIAAEGEDVNSGETATLLVNVLSGTAPFNIEWRNGLHEVIGTTTLESMDQTSSFEFTPTYPDDYYVTVTDANMRTATDTARVVVITAEPLVADFENLYLEDNAFWKGPDTKGTFKASPYGYGRDLCGSFVSGSYQFENRYNTTYNSWAGFAYSSRTATNFRSYTTDDCNSVVGHGVDESHNFAVAYDASNITLLTTTGAVVPGFYVTNTANNVNAYLNGDGMTDAFTTGDYFKLIVTGHNGDTVTGTVEVLLADYTSENEEEHSYIADWQYVDLNTLGTVTSISFSYEGGHSNDWGLTTPTYVCIDNFGAAPILPELAIAVEGDDVNAGEEATLTLIPADGTAPFQYQWQNGKHEIIAEGTIESFDEVMAVVNYTPTECDDYYVYVTDANGFTACDTARIVVRSAEPVVATFENLYLDAESSWVGPDTKGETVIGAWGSTDIRGSFVSGSYQFINQYTPAWGSWSGFGYTNSTSTTFRGYSMGDDMNSIVGHGADDSENFAVCFDNSTIQLLNSTTGAVVPGFYVTNTANNVNAYLNGDGMTDAFTTGDYFKLIVTGHNGDTVTGTVEVLLADYTSENEEEHSYIADWQYVDLSTLGTVTSISFSYEGGHSNDWGLTTPTYVCIDNFGASAPIVDSITRQTASTDAADIEAIYTTDGIRIRQMQKGINILRMTDGTVRRILVK